MLDHIRCAALTRNKLSCRFSPLNKGGGKVGEYYLCDVHMLSYNRGDEVALQIERIVLQKSLKESTVTPLGMKIRISVLGRHGGED